MRRHVQQQHQQQLLFFCALLLCVAAALATAAEGTPCRIQRRLLELTACDELAPGEVPTMEGGACGCLPLHREATGDRRAAAENSDARTVHADSPLQEDMVTFAGASASHANVRL